MIDPPRKDDRRHIVAVMIASAVAVLAIGWPSFSAGLFLEDDLFTMQLTRQVGDPGGLAQLWSPTSDVYPHYRPLPFTLLWLGFKAWGDTLWAFHLLTLCTHLVTAWLGFWLLRRLRTSLSTSTLATMLFVAHPVVVQSAVWISNFHIILCFLLYLGAMHTALSYYRSARFRWLAATSVLLMLSCLSKSLATSFPALLVLAILAGLLARKKRTWILLAVSFATCLLGGFLETQVFATADRVALVELSLVDHVLLIALSSARYLRNAALPHPLPFYSQDSWGAMDVFVLVAAAAALGALFLKRRKRELKVLGVGLLAFFALISPTWVAYTQSWQLSPASDRYAYLSVFVFVAILAYLAGALLEGRPRAARQAGRWTALALVIVLGTLSYLHARRYQVPLRLLEYSRAHNPDQVQLTTMEAWWYWRNDQPEKSAALAREVVSQGGQENGRSRREAWVLLINTAAYEGSPVLAEVSPLARRYINDFILGESIALKGDLDKGIDLLKTTLTGLAAEKRLPDDCIRALKWWGGETLNTLQKAKNDQ